MSDKIKEKRDKFLRVRTSKKKLKEIQEFLKYIRTYFKFRKEKMTDDEIISTTLHQYKAEIQTRKMMEEYERARKTAPWEHHSGR